MSRVAVVELPRGSPGQAVDSATGKRDEGFWPWVVIKKVQQTLNSEFSFCHGPSLFRTKKPALIFPATHFSKSGGCCLSSLVYYSPREGSSISCIPIIQVDGT